MEKEDFYVPRNLGSSKEGTADPEALEGAIVWTETSVYRIIPNGNIHEILYRLIADGRETDGAEPLGNTLGIDVLKMFEKAGDFYFHSGAYGRAFDMYFLSNVCSKKILFNFLRIERMNEVTSHLRVLLHHSSPTSLQDREWLSTVYLECHLQAVVAHSNVNRPSQASPSSVEDIIGKEMAEMCTFLVENSYCDRRVVLKRLMEVGLRDCFLFYANVKGCMEEAMEMLMTSECLVVEDHQVAYLIYHGYAPSLRKCCGGALYQSLQSRRKLFVLIPPDPQSFDILRMFPSIDIRRISNPTEKTLMTKFPFKEMGRWVAEDWSPEVRNAYHLGTLATPDASRSEVTVHQFCSEVRYLMRSLQFPDFLLLLKFFCVLEASPEMTIQLKRTQVDKEISLLHISRSVASGFEDIIETMLLLIAHLHSWGSRFALSSLHHRHHVLQLHSSSSSSSLSDLHSKEEADDFIPSSPLPSDERRDSALSSRRSDLRKSLLDRIVRNPIQIVSIAAGSAHACAVDSRGYVFSWGKNTYGQLGIGNVSSVASPVRIPSFTSDPIDRVSCGGEFTLCLTRGGSVWAFGNCEVGQLGLGRRDPSHIFPTLISALSRVTVIDLACGMYHSLVVDSGGNVWVFGEGRQGQLGIGSDRIEDLPCRLSLRNICQVSAGYSHSVALNTGGDVFTWGSGSHGELGHGSEQSVRVPSMVQKLDGKCISKIACGAFHTIAVTDLNNVYIWGNANGGQLGIILHNKEECVTEPVLVESFYGRTIGCVSAGVSHSAAVTNAGALYMWGSGDHGQLGVGKVPILNEPKVVTLGSPVKSVACGDCFSLVLCGDGSVLSFGANNHFQTGLLIHSNPN